MRLSDHDASFLYNETASGNMHGGSVSMLEGEVSHEEVLNFTAGRIHLAPRLRERLVFVPGNIAHPKWVADPDFDIRNHIRSHKLVLGTSLEDGIQEALKLCEPLLRRDRPLWLNYVVEGVRGHTLLVQMAHHAMIDGASGVDLSYVLTDFEPDAPPPPPPGEPWAPARLPTPTELWTEALSENLQQNQGPFRPINRTPETERLLRSATEVMQSFMTEPAMTAPWNAAAVGPKRNFRWMQREFSELREIRRAFGGTINDVVVAVVMESAARYLKTKGEAVDNQHLRLMCPVNVRREDDEGALGNRVSALYPYLSAEPMDILDRLETVKEEMDRRKSNMEPQALELLMETQPNPPPVAMAQTLLVGTPLDPTAALAQFPPPVPPQFGPRPPLVGFNFTCSNVPGVQVPQYIAGCKILGTVGMLMLGGTLGYGVVVGSYNQQLFFNFTSDTRLLADLDKMRLGVAERLDELLDLARSKNASAA